jgi:c-di-AMP phosphodiesterase-like protein
MWIPLLIIFFLLITGIVLIALNKMAIGISIIVVTVLAATYLVYRYKFEDKIIASQINKITTSKDGLEKKSLFDKLCDKLFRNQGKETYEQYVDMRRRRSEYESANLCKNLAVQKLAT